MHLTGTDRVWGLPNLPSDPSRESQVFSTQHCTPWSPCASPATPVILLAQVRFGQCDKQITGCSWILHYQFLCRQSLLPKVAGAAVLQQPVSRQKICDDRTHQTGESWTFRCIEMECNGGDATTVNLIHYNSWRTLNAVPPRSKSRRSRAILRHYNPPTSRAPYTDPTATTITRNKKQNQMSSSVCTDYLYRMAIGDST